jgi:hypothetical protein
VNPAAGSQELDFEALEKAAVYEAPYSKTHRQGQSATVVLRTLSCCVPLRPPSSPPHTRTPPLSPALLLLLLLLLPRRIIRELWEVVHSLSPEEKRRFLAFCTGSDRSPIKGLGSLRFTVSRAGPDSEQLPTSHTCFNHLLLMEYSTKEKLERKLRAAIRESEGFGLI